MNYYVLSQKEEPGCPIGILYADLYDKFYSSTKGVEFGFFPWYAEKGKPGPRTPFPEGMVLISKDKYYDFDIRSISRFFYIVSDEFLAACNGLNVNIVDGVKIEVLSEAGERISSKNYNAVLFEELDVRSNSDPASTFVEENGRAVRFKRLILPSDWKLDLFKYKRLISGSDSLICSQTFKDLAINFKGIAFTPLESVLWSGIRRI
ncbi:Imm43 family immunity protein [Pseudomonas fluorescens]|uniref:Imm43 family immunity protein n=1 Tax=Pseudomonas fluorescens TaxID=294 RepID=UPI003D20EC88